MQSRKVNATDGWLLCNRDLSLSRPLFVDRQRTERIDIRTRVDIARQGHATTLLHYWCLMDGFYGMGCLGVCGSPSLACRPPRVTIIFSLHMALVFNDDMCVHSQPPEMYLIKTLVSSIDWLSPFFFVDVFRSYEIWQLDMVFL